QAPTVADKLAGQPIEQLGVSRRRTGFSEVAQRRDDPCSKVVLPEPIDDDARGERVIGCSQPARKREPSARLARTWPGWFHCKGRLAIRQHAGYTRAHQRTRIQWIAATINV